MIRISIALIQYIIVLIIFAVHSLFSSFYPPAPWPPLCWCHFLLRGVLLLSHFGVTNISRCSPISSPSSPLPSSSLGATQVCWLFGYICLICDVDRDHRAFGLASDSQAHEAEEEVILRDGPTIWDILPQRSMSQSLARVNTIEILAPHEKTSPLYRIDVITGNRDWRFLLRWMLMNWHLSEEEMPPKALPEQSSDREDSDVTTDRSYSDQRPKCSGRTIIWWC